ncbi:hypothetical protein AVEN_131142-1 [Araneus ventricosus]|uniref:Uncharacterized protein n=1 Tax=Araneus ventricosus TaxID=182803 RepID=A0A4Y2HCG6_ARAVE|nr:hypothetical protein AVEN_131142-1 [Araneus ventricosus]
MPEELSESSNVDLSMISRRLEAIGMICKQRNRLTYESYEIQERLKGAKCPVNSCMKDMAEKFFLHYCVCALQVMKNATIIRSTKIHSRRTSTSTEKPNIHSTLRIVGSDGCRVL